MVVGGSTGAGKSTLVNSLIGAEISAGGCAAPDDPRSGAGVPSGRRGLVRGRPRAARAWRARAAAPPAPGGLELVPTDRLPSGLALLDAPDIDSVVEANRALAGQLLAAADAWLFVTTAARYADAVPWGLLESARERGTALVARARPRPARRPRTRSPRTCARCSPSAGSDPRRCSSYRRRRWTTGGCRRPRSRPVRAWLDGLAADAEARAALVRRTLAGALASVPGRGATVPRRPARSRRRPRASCAPRCEHAYGDALADVDEAVRSGALLRGEVLARWHDVVGTGDLMRTLESHIGRLRDRLRSFVTGRPAAEAELRTAVQTGVDAVVVAAADRAAERRRRRLAPRARRPAAARRRRASRRRGARPRRAHRRRGARLAGRGARVGARGGSRQAQRPPGSPRSASTAPGSR